MTTQTTQTSSSNHTEESISTPDVKKSNGVRIAVFIFLSIVILITITKIINNMPKKIDKTRNESTRNVINTIPSVYNEYYTFKKGDEVIRVKVPSGYSYTCSGGGKKYYHQAQNSQKEVWGDGTYHKAGEHVAYFDLSYYNEEIIVVCELKKL